jgi:putative methylase
VRALERVPPFARGRAALEQIASPAEAAAEMLESALAAGDLAGETVVDLGAGTGRLAIGAALLGAAAVTAVEIDASAIRVGRSAADAAHVAIEWVEGDVAEYTGRAHTVVMNPPFGAQRRGADRPFWTTALRSAEAAVYAFALADSRTFIAERAVERPAYIDATRPVAWELGRLFPHHRKDRVPIAVDLWVIRKGEE